MHPRDGGDHPPHARHNPNSDIVIIYFVNPEMLETWQAGQVPLPVAAHDEVARHYGIPTINLAKEVADRITAGTFTWQEYGGTHPAPAGNALCAEMIDRLMSIAWAKPLADNAVAVCRTRSPSRLTSRATPMAD